MSLAHDTKEFSHILNYYIKIRGTQVGSVFEEHKKALTRSIMRRRGQLSRPTVHLGVGGVVVIAATSGLVGGASEVSSQYPEIEAATPQLLPQTELAAYLGDLSSLNTETTISEKPRDQIIEHEIKGGETLSSIAKQYSISVDTIRWSNNIEDVGSIKPGQLLKILPVTGVAHTVQRGDTVYTVGKKYDSNPQSIVDFPFNDIGENLGIRIGQVLIVPDGAPPEKPKPSKAPAQVIAGPSSPQAQPSVQGDGNATGNFIWPVRGLITQSYKNYHKGLDIAGDTGTPVVASDGGEVIVSGWVDNSGYGNRVMIRHSNGYTTLYAHLASGSNRVKVGDKVSQGQTIGLRGSTGRSTGPHLHFEIRKGASFYNPSGMLN